MCAGKGIMHAEMPVHVDGAPDPRGLQLWVDLPKQYKMVVSKAFGLLYRPQPNPGPELSGTGAQRVRHMPFGCMFAELCQNSHSVS